MNKDTKVTMTTNPNGKLPGRQRAMNSANCSFIHSMLVVESPSVIDDPVPRGTFVIVAVDPIASVAELDDAQATAEAAAIQPTKFLAITGDHSGFEIIPDANVLKLCMDFFGVHDSLPEPPYEWASVPVIPAVSHPKTGREPLSASAPLPWSNCHIRTLWRTTGIVSRIHQHSTPGPFFTKQEERRMRRMQHDDSCRAVDDANSLLSQSAIGQDCNSAAHRLLSQTKEVFYDSDYRATTISEFFPQNEWPSMKLHFEMWVDIASVAHLGKPDNVDDEIERLRQIEWDWAQRYVANALANRPETIAWLEGISEADVPPLEINPFDEFDDDDDDSIVPEDAIDHLIEQEVSDEDLLYIHEDDSSEHGLDVTPHSIAANRTPDIHSPNMDERGSS